MGMGVARGGREGPRLPWILKISAKKVVFVVSSSDVSESFLSSQSHKPFESESSQSHLKLFRVESES